MSGLSLIVGRFGSTPQGMLERCARHPDALVVDLQAARCNGLPNYALGRGNVNVRVRSVLVVRVVCALLAAAGHVVSLAELVEVNWGDDPEGGIDNPAAAIAVALVEARTVGAALGIVITTRHGFGWTARLKHRQEGTADEADTKAA